MLAEKFLNLLDFKTYDDIEECRRQAPTVFCFVVAGVGLASLVDKLFGCYRDCEVNKSKD